MRAAPVADHQREKHDPDQSVALQFFAPTERGIEGVAAEHLQSAHQHDHREERDHERFGRAVRAAQQAADGLREAGHGFAAARIFFNRSVAPRSAASWSCSLIAACCQTVVSMG